MTLGQRIQEFRKKAGLSQEGLGEALGVSRQAVSKWESDGGIPELNTLIAMSRLFGVSIGELLGVEPPAADDGEEARDGKEAEMEELLRRYVRITEQKSRREKDERRLTAAICAGVAVLLLFLGGSWINGKFQATAGTIRILQSDLSILEETVAGQIQEITGSVEDILSAQGRLESSFSWTVTGFNEVKQTVLLALDLRLKTYIPGYTVQFVADWTRMDGSTGQTVGKEVEGPDFADELRLPMNYEARLSVRVRNENGVLYEQALETIYDGMNLENFELWAQNLSSPFSLRMGVTTTTAERRGVVISSTYPELFAPTRGTLTAEINGEEQGSWPLTLTEAGTGLWYGSIEAEEPPLLRLSSGDAVAVTLTLRDSRGREKVYRESGYVRGDGVTWKASAEGSSAAS